jgi:hypothetical protein
MFIETKQVNTAKAMASAQAVTISPRFLPITRHSRPVDWPGGGDSQAWVAAVS